MVLSGETAPLRAREEATTPTTTAASSSSGRGGNPPLLHHGGRGGSYEAGDDVLLGERAFPVAGVEAAADDTLKRIRRVMYSAMTAATMAATGAALVLMVWTQRSHTLQGQWRPVPGLDLDATYGGDDEGFGFDLGGGNSGSGGWTMGGGQAGTMMVDRHHHRDGAFSGAAAALGSSQSPKFYLYDEIYRMYEPIVACTSAGGAGGAGGEGSNDGDDGKAGDLTSLRVESELVFYKSLADHPWRTDEPCEASVFVIPALPLAERYQKEGCAPPDFVPAKLHKMMFAVLGKSPFFAQNAGRDHLLFSAEGAPRDAPNDDVGLRSTLRNIVAAKTSLGGAAGLEGWGSDDADIDWLSVPGVSAALGRRRRGSGEPGREQKDAAEEKEKERDLEVVIVPLSGDEDELASMVDVAIGNHAAGGGDAMVVEVPKQEATAAARRRRALLTKGGSMSSQMAAAVAEAAVAGDAAEAARAKALSSGESLEWKRDDDIDMESSDSERLDASRDFVESRLGDAEPRSGSGNGKGPLLRAARKEAKKSSLFPPNVKPQFYEFRQMPPKKHNPAAAHPASALGGAAKGAASGGAAAAAAPVIQRSAATPVHTPSAAAAAAAKDKAVKEDAIIKATTTPIISEAEQHKLDTAKAVRRANAPAESKREAREELAAAAAREAMAARAEQQRARASRWGVWARTPGLSGDSSSAAHAAAAAPHAHLPSHAPGKSSEAALNRAEMESLARTAVLHSAAKQVADGGHWGSTLPRLGDSQQTETKPADAAAAAATTASADTVTAADAASASASTADGTWMSMDADSQEAYQFWDVNFKRSGLGKDAAAAAAASEGPSPPVKTREETVTTDAAAAFARANYCVVVTAPGRKGASGAAASALADAVAAHCLPVLVADTYPTAFSDSVRWAEFVILVPHKYWRRDAVTVLGTVRSVYGDPRLKHTAGSRKLSVLHAVEPDLLWQHPDSRVMFNLLLAACHKVEERMNKVANTGKSASASGGGGKRSKNPACDDEGSSRVGPQLAVAASASAMGTAPLGEAEKAQKGNELELAALGAPKVSSTWARRAGMEKLIGKGLHATPGALPLVRKAKPQAAELKRSRPNPGMPEPSLHRSSSSSSSSSAKGKGKGHASHSHSAVVSVGRPRARLGQTESDIGDATDATPELDSDTDAFLKSLDVGSNGKNSGKVTLPGTPEFEEAEDQQGGGGGSSGGGGGGGDEGLYDDVSILAKQDGGGGGGGGGGGEEFSGGVEIGGSIRPPHEDIFASLAKKPHDKAWVEEQASNIPDQEVPAFGGGGGDFVVPGGGAGSSKGGGEEAASTSGSSSDAGGGDAAPTARASDNSQFSSFFLPSELFKHEGGGGGGSGGGGGGGGGGSSRSNEPSASGDAGGRRYGGADATGRDYYVGDGANSELGSRGRRRGGGGGRYDTAGADDDFAHKIANILKTDRDEDRKWDLASEVLHAHMNRGGGGGGGGRSKGVNSRAIARSISNQLKRSLSHLNNNNNNNNNNNRGGGGDSDEDMALRVAEILRPVLARNDMAGGEYDDAGLGGGGAVLGGGDSGGGGGGGGVGGGGGGVYSTGGSRLGQGLVEININTNGGGSSVSSAATTAEDVLKEQLYQRVVGKMGLTEKVGGAAPGAPLDPSLEKAATMFVNEMANSGALDGANGGGGGVNGVNGGGGVGVKSATTQRRPSLPGDIDGSALVPDDDEVSKMAALRDKVADAAESALEREAGDHAAKAEAAVEAAGAARARTTAPSAKELEAKKLTKVETLAEAGKRQRDALMSELLMNDEDGKKSGKKSGKKKKSLVAQFSPPPAFSTYAPKPPADAAAAADHHHHRGGTSDDATSNGGGVGGGPGGGGGGSSATALSSGANPFDSSFEALKPMPLPMVNPGLFSNPFMQQQQGQQQPQLLQGQQQMVGPDGMPLQQNPFLGPQGQQLNPLATQQQQQNPLAMQQMQQMQQQQQLAQGQPGGGAVGAVGAKDDASSSASAGGGGGGGGGGFMQQLTSALTPTWNPFGWGTQQQQPTTQLQQPMQPMQQQAVDGGAAAAAAAAAAAVDGELSDGEKKGGKGKGAKQPAWAHGAAEQQLSHQREEHKSLRPQHQQRGGKGKHEGKSHGGKSKSGGDDEDDDEFVFAKAKAEVEAVAAADFDASDSKKSTLNGLKEEMLRKDPMKKEKGEEEEEEGEESFEYDADAESSDYDFNAVPLTPEEKKLKRLQKKAEEEEEPAGPEVAGIDGVLETAVAMMKVSNKKPKVERFMLPGEVASDNSVADLGSEDEEEGSGGLNDIGSGSGKKKGSKPRAVPKLGAESNGEAAGEISLAEQAQGTLSALLSEGGKKSSGGGSEEEDTLSLPL